MNIIEPNSQPGKENVSTKGVLDVGSTLRQERERLGMSVHDIAERIKFAPKQVEALEANDFAHLPQATFLRGFVRSYARVLQLDEVALIAALPFDKPKQAANRTQTVNVAFPNKLMRQRINLLWLGGALGVVVVLALFLALHQGEPVAKTGVAILEPVPLPAADVAVSAVVNTETGPANISENAPGKAEPITVVESPKEVAPPPKVVEPVKKPQPVPPPALVKKPEPVEAAEQRKTPEPDMNRMAVISAPAPEATSGPAATASPGLPLEVLMRRPLHFVFADAMFAEVIDVNGSVLLSRDVPRGAEKWIGGPGRAPYRISISKPGKARLYYKGKEIDLSIYPPAEMAHLKVQ